MSIAIGATSAVASAIQGIAASSSTFDADAQAIATSDGGDPVAAVVDMTQQNIALQVDVRVLALANKMLGSLLDVKA